MGEIIKIVPRTVKAIELLGADNGMVMRPQDEWPAFIDYLYLERELAALSPAELDTFITGEISEAAEIAERRGLAWAHEFFELIFDGQLNRYFYYE